MVKTRTQRRQLRHLRLRNKLEGTAARPRMAVSFSGKNIYVQFVDDLAGKTLAAVSTVEKEFGGKAKVNHSNVAAAKKLGGMAAQRALAKKIKAVVFDRGGFQYHGRVVALADAAREAGLQF